MLNDYLGLDQIDLCNYYSMLETLENLKKERKMKISFFKVFTVFTIIVKWADKALDDGRIDSEEALELVVSLLEAIGLPAEVILPDNFMHVKSL